MTFIHRFSTFAFRIQGKFKFGEGGSKRDDSVAPQQRDSCKHPTQSLQYIPGSPIRDPLLHLHIHIHPGLNIRSG